jgi:virginiamycin B lyase
MGSLRSTRSPPRLSSPRGIAAGPDGALWFVEYDGNKIGRITTEGAFTEYPIPTANSYPSNIAAGPHGLWFTESEADKIGHVTLSGTVTEIPTPTRNSAPIGIILGPRAMWFTEWSAGKIAAVRPSTLTGHHSSRSSSSGWAQPIRRVVRPFGAGGAACVEGRRSRG